MAPQISRKKHLGPNKSFRRDPDDSEGMIVQSSDLPMKIIDYADDNMRWKVQLTLVILVLTASFALFKFHRSQQVTNETAAVMNLKTVASAEGVFLNEDGYYGTIEELIHYRWLDPSFAASKSGYDFSVVPNQLDYLATATRTNHREGRYEFFVTADGIVRYSRHSQFAPSGRAGLPVD
jgi:hypothetical protein